MMKDKFSAILKIAAQAFPVTAALAQWLSEIEGEVDARLARLEDPLAKYGPGARELCRILYSLVRAQPQDVATNHLDWTAALHPFVKEMRHFEADGLLAGSHRIGTAGAFAQGFRLGPAFTVYLATLHEDPTKLGAIAGKIESATEQIDGFALQQSTGVPLTVINALFTEYAARGQGVKSQTIGSSIYIPHR
jgi:hypothetical protein